MAFHDYFIDNGSGSAVRQDLNYALAAIVTNNSAASEPVTTYPYMWWADTTAGILKMRNGADNGWISLRELDGTLIIEGGSAATPGLYFTGDVNTGIYSPGAEQFGIATNGVDRTYWTSTALVINEVGADYDVRIEGDTNANLFYLDASTDRIGFGTNAPSTGFHVALPAASATIGNFYVAPSVAGQARCHVYNGGATAEWLFGQKTSTDHGFKISKLVAGVESDYLELTTNGELKVGNVAIADQNGLVASGSRNRIINGAMAIDQRNSGASQSFTAGAALAYAVDRWYGYCTGSTVTGQRVQGANAGLFRYQFTGGASVTAIGFGQRIESLNSADLAGTTATLSVVLANSLLTTVTWTAFYATTANTFGTLASPTRTQIATGTFTVTSTATRYSTQISIPGAAVTGIEIVFTVGAQTSGTTWTIGDVQLEAGSFVTPFERRSVGLERLLCERYYQHTIRVRIGGLSSSGIGFHGADQFLVQFRAIPTMTQRNAAYVGGSSNLNVTNITNTSFDFDADNSAGSGIASADYSASAEL